MTPIHRLMLATIVLVPFAAEADPVETAVMVNDPNFVPELTVVQEINGFGQLRYARIVEEDMHLEAWLKGRCGSNWRVQAARIDSHYAGYDGKGGAVEGPASSGDSDDDDTAEEWHLDFEVDQDKLTFGPHEPELEEVPTAWLRDRLTRAGEELVRDLADLSGNSRAFVRSLDLRVDNAVSLTFWMTCRRYAGGNEHIIKTHNRKFPLKVTYRGATADGPDIVLNPVPPEQPVPPIPFGELTDRTRIEQAHLMIIPDDRPDTCGMFLSASFRTSGPTVITYRIVDAAGARSPVHDVGVGPTRAAFVSHEIDFSEGSGATIGFTAADNPAQPGGIAFGSSLVDVPSDNLRGYYRIETIAPHRSASNIVSYNLEDCSGEEGPGAWLFDAVVLGDPDKLREAFRQASSIEGYSRASAR